MKINDPSVAKYIDRVFKGKNNCTNNGFLHDGHLSLMKQCEISVTSLVKPLNLVRQKIWTYP